MKYLNLSKDFNPFKAKYVHCINFESFTFPGGEPHIKLIGLPVGNSICITHRINSFNDLGLLLVAVDALRRIMHLVSLDLFIPYFPGARQDRVCENGESLTVKIYADIINSMKVDTVTIFDPHSDVTPALINNCIVIDNHKFVSKCIEDIYKKNSSLESDMLLISPDAGANKKISKLAKYLWYSENRNRNIEIIKCDKNRDTETGKLYGFEVYADDLKGKDCIIVDDICDGGGTFIGLAKELKKKNAGDLYLIVSHGIFSMELHDLSKYFRGIYTTDSFRKGDDIKDKNFYFKQIKLSEIFYEKIHRQII